MSSIADALLSQPSASRCRFSALTGKLDSDDLSAIYTAMTAGVSANIVARAIRSGGHKISHSTISEHKEKRCMCRGEYQWV